MKLEILLFVKAHNYKYAREEWIKIPHRLYLYTRLETFKLGRTAGCVILSVTDEKNPFDVRAYSEGDEAQIVEVLKLSLPEWTVVKNPVDYWGWKYKSNPNGFECYTISMDDKIIGVSHSINMRIKIGNEIVIAQCGTDDAIHPDYRGKGIYKVLRAGKKPLQSKDITVAIWSARNPVMINYANSLGRIPIPFKINKMMRIKNITRHIASNPSNKPWSYPTLFYMKSINKLKILNNPKKTNEVQISRINGFDSDIDTFCNRIHNHYKLTLVRDQPYLNWRYSNPEAEEVVILQAKKNDDITGFCVAEIKESPKKLFEAHILDLLCLPGDNTTPYNLINAQLEILDEKNVNDVHYRITHKHPYREIAERCGFLDMTRWSTMKYYIKEKEGNNYFKKNIEEMRSFPEYLVYLSHGDIL